MYWTIGKAGRGLHHRGFANGHPMQPQAELAPIWRRLVALCYESLLLIAVIMAAAMAFQLLWPGDPQSAITRYTRFGYMMALLFGYFSWCWQRSGQTLAMKTWRLRLVAAGSQPLSWKMMTIRFLLVLAAILPLPPAWIWAKHVPDMKWVLWLACAWAALPYLWAFIDRDRQFLHDRLVGTRLTLAPIGKVD
jgi:uncharacterized RDD family membrane protein YckC